MSLSSAGYPAVGYPSLHVFGGRTAKLFDMRLVTQSLGKQTVFGFLPQWGVTRCNRELGNHGQPNGAFCAHRDLGRDQTTRSSCCSSETIGAKCTDHVIPRGLRSENLKRGERSG
jgi:hypothetical protein